MSTENKHTGPVNAASILAELESSDNTKELETATGKEEQLEETLAETSEELEKTEDSLEDHIEDDDLEDDTELPDSDESESDQQLDPILLEAIKGNPKAEKRLADMQKGFTKIREREAKIAEELQATKPLAERFQQWQIGFTNPEFVAQNVNSLLTHLAGIHKTTVHALLEQANLKAALPKAELMKDDGDWESSGFDSETEYRHEKTLREVAEKNARLESALQELLKDREESRKQADFKALVESVAPKTIKLVAKSLGGWTVDEKMIAETMREYPQQFKENPVKAVKRAYPDEYIAFKTNAVAKSHASKQRGPEVLPQTTGKGRVSKPASVYRAEDALADILGN